MEDRQLLIERWEEFKTECVPGAPIRVDRVSFWLLIANTFLFLLSRGEDSSKDVDLRVTERPEVTAQHLRETIEGGAATTTEKDVSPQSLRDAERLQED